jgi:DNA ligase 1
MLAFASLLERLVLTPSRSEKLALLAEHMRTTPDPDRGWALAAITGDLKLKSVRPAQIRELAKARVDPVLFALSYDYVGDLAETVSLIWPARPGSNRAPEVSEVVETLASATRSEGPAHVDRWLDALTPTGRWALLKLVTGGLRIGVSARLARQALADFGQRPIAEIEELWHAQTAPYGELFAWLDGSGPRPDNLRPAPFRAVMLAHPLFEKSDRGDPLAIDRANISADVYAAEWKWDGVRVQVSGSGGVVRLYTRTGDDISAAFPDVAAGLAFDGAIDGELLVRGPEGGVAPFNDLQQRLNRKTVTARQILASPAFVRAYDLLVDGEDDLRALPFAERRLRLERRIVSLQSDRLDLSPLIAFTSAEDLDALRREPPTPEIEGLMLKRWDSPYVAGRPAGPWFKWKRDPLRIDAVLMYAQRGHGRRSSFYSDFTFGVWRTGDAGEELAPVGKAYFGFTDEEMKRLDRHVRDNTTERFGPVRAVTATREAGLVLEIAFDGVQRSSRHRSGLALRFPRIARIRWDKPSAEADRIDTLESLLESTSRASPA